MKCSTRTLGSNGALRGWNTTTGARHHTMVAAAVERLWLRSVFCDKFGVGKQETLYCETPNFEYTLGLATWLLLVGPSHVRTGRYLKRIHLRMTRVGEGLVVMISTVCTRSTTKSALDPSVNKEQSLLDWMNSFAVSALANL